MRLKGQLVGRKRGLGQEEVDVAMRKVDDEDEEESRAGAIKKKVKLDPFDRPHKKKKGEAVAPSILVPSTSSTSKDSVEGRISTEDTDSTKAPSTQSEPQTQSSSKKKKKKNKLSVSPPGAVLVASGSDNEGVEVEETPASAPRANAEEKGKSCMHLFVHRRGTSAQAK